MTMSLWAICPVLIMISIMFVLSSLLMSLAETPIHTGERADTTTSLTVQGQLNSRWHPAVYKGLIMGTSTQEDMIRVLGEPQSSELFNDGNGSSEEWFHYESGGDFPGELVFSVDPKSKVILELILHPTKLSKEQAIKHFGQNYKSTRYEFCKGFEDEESAPVYETPRGQFLTVEYRANGVAVAIGANEEVEYISYLSRPLGAKCK